MLPKITHPTFEFVVPSTKTKVLFRPFLVKEEKMLLFAKSSNDPADIFRAVKQVVNNCSLIDSFDIDKLAIFDLEYLFLQIRAVSVNNMVKVSYRDTEEQTKGVDKIYDFDIDISKLEVKFPDNVSKTIKVSNSIGLTMKYPSASLFDDKEFLSSGEESLYELIVRSIDKIYDGDDIHDPLNYSKTEMEEFLDDCGIKTFKKLQEFMSNVPRLYHKLAYTNTLGNQKTIELTTLNDFFTLG
jgi:hypothetical protein